MNDELKQKASETRLNYIKRIVFGKLKDRTIKEDYVTISPFLFNMDLSESECRKRMYGILNLLEQVEHELTTNIEDDEILNQVMLERLELEKERKKIQTVNLSINRNLRRVARNELTQESIIDSINNLSPLKLITPLERAEGSKEGILPISDIHFGKECVIKGLKGEIINEYNEKVFERRMLQLLDEIIFIINKEGFEKLNVLLTGDLIDGILRMTQLQKLQYGIIESTMRLAEFLATWLNELSEHVLIELYYCLGNHSQIRPLGSQNGDFAEENMETVIVWFLKSRLMENANINFHDNEGDFIFFDCKGLSIMASHGEERNLEQAIKDYMLMYGKRIDMFIGGHLHTKENKSIGISHNGLSDVEYCRVKSICSIDSYSTKLRKSSGAGASCFVIEQGRGKTITYDINLQ